LLSEFFGKQKARINFLNEETEILEKKSTPKSSISREALEIS
jgi:hypothetical protein